MTCRYRLHDQENMIAASRPALVFELVQRPSLAEMVGVSDGLHPQQPNNRSQSTARGSNAPYCHSEAFGRTRGVQVDNVDKMLGFVPNLKPLMSISPNALSGWASLMGSLAKTLDLKTRDGIALAVSEADGCD